MASSTPAHLESIIQACSYIKKMDEYVAVGMETVLDTAEDVAPLLKEGPNLKSLRNDMLEYCKMESALKNVCEAVDYIKAEAQTMPRQGEGDEGQDTEGDLLAKFENHLVMLESRTKKSKFKDHPRYVELQTKIDDLLNAEDSTINAPTTSTPGSTSELQSEGLEVTMTQADINVKCPYTGKEMVDPVRNRHCNHNYEHKAILDFMKSRGRRAKCPVGGCVNDKHLEASDLEENKELKRHIEKKRREKTGRKRGRNT